MIYTVSLTLLGAFFGHIITFIYFNRKDTSFHGFYSSISGFHPFPTGNLLEECVWYEDNEPYLKEVRISLPYLDWFEFEKTQVYQDLKLYLQNIETPETQSTCQAEEQ